MWTYSGDPLNSPLDKIRFMVGDTDVEDPQLQDEEILYALEESAQQSTKAAIVCCEALLAKWMKEVNYRTESEQISLSDRAKAVRGVLATLKTKLKEESRGYPTLNVKNPWFEMGMHDNA